MVCVYTHITARKVPFTGQLPDEEHYALLVKVPQELLVELTGKTHSCLLLSWEG